MGRLASRREMRVSAVSAFGTSLEAAANLHVAAVLDNLSAGAELCTGLIEEDPTTPSLPVASEVEIPSRPGIGVELDDELFEGK
jgi:L-alanine-DL-glutamate epimerase-like enolase superfamily enzyme